MDEVAPFVSREGRVTKPPFECDACRDHGFVYIRDSWAEAQCVKCFHVRAIRKALADDARPWYVKLFFWIAKRF